MRKMCGPMWASAPTKFCGGREAGIILFSRGDQWSPAGGQCPPLRGQDVSLYMQEGQPPLHKGAVKNFIYAFFFLVSIARAAKLMNSAPQRGMLLMSPVAGTE